MKRCPLCDEIRDADRERCYQCEALLVECKGRERKQRSAGRFIADLGDLAGETIEEADETDHGVAIKFVGERFAFIRAVDTGFSCCDDCEWSMELVDDEKHLGRDTKLAFGLITQADVDAEQAEKMRQHEERERKRYEELKRKFEPAK